MNTRVLYGALLCLSSRALAEQGQPLIELPVPGHGTAMVLALEERAHELGYRMLVADTTSGQLAALGLYGKFGWYETHREIVGDLVNVYLAKQL